ncbi:UNVERIFIED_CONTAM: hypothetical protein HDU68_009096 [Siphonaria sp. JEL0065]|nr:hypothetical protein HDU68_009096 [Siphonaria sp. JEL0065]
MNSDSEYSEIESEQEDYETDYDMEGSEDEEEADVEMQATQADSTHLTPFSVLSRIDLQAKEKAIATQLGSVLSLPVDVALELLHETRFEFSEADRLYDNPQAWDKVQAALKNVAMGTTTSAVSHECSICCSDSPASLALACNHSFCSGCWSQFCEQKINDEGVCDLKCIQTGCNQRIDRNTVLSLVSPPTAAKYKSLLLKSFVDSFASLKWCPAPNCESAVECKAKYGNGASITLADLNSNIPSVLCECGHFFCFACLSDDHKPAPCGLIKLWLKKCADDSETANWICANTKDCPKCHTAIEKNGGCNHMSCRKAGCRHEFCWICMGDWKGHNCSQYVDPQTTSAKEKSRSVLERYLHYFNRYAIHDQSLKLDKKLSEKIEAKVLEIQKNSDLSWIEAQFITEAKVVLLASRQVLKWTYCFAFYLDKNNACYLFEDNQRDLEQSVEALSLLLENEFTPEKIPELRSEILNKKSYVEQRKETLLISTLGDLKSGKFEWCFTG